jgi:hypothetical protein
MIGGRIVQLLESIITGGSVKLAAGNNNIGQVGIDQTTDGTTNRVVAKISQVEGENLVQLSGSILAEQLTNDDAVANVLTFSENISIIEIFHEELTWQEFTVNGITLTVPGGGYRTPIGGTPAATVTIPSISCIVGRQI